MNKQELLNEVYKLDRFQNDIDYPADLINLKEVISLIEKLDEEKIAIEQTIKRLFSKAFNVADDDD